MDRTQISFETQRLGIRSCKLSDADTLSSLMTAQISQWVAHWPFPLSPQQAQANIASYLETASASLGFPAVICENQTGQIIGWHLLQLRQDPENSAHFSYWSGEDFQRQGFAFELARAMITFAFESWDIKQVIAGAQFKNAASISMLRKLGMQPSHQARVWTPVRTRYETCVFFSLHKAMWRSVS
jgi:ribosomal-protein-alanine N-acetyltransferase